MAIKTKELIIQASGSKNLLHRTGSTETILRQGVGIWEVDPDDNQSVQFRIPSASVGTQFDRIGFYISGSGKIGIGTKDPETAFDIRDIGEDTEITASAAKTKIFTVSRERGQEFKTAITASVISASILQATQIVDDGQELRLKYSPVAGGANIVTVGALNAGSITSGFTSIDVGAGDLKTTGILKGGNITASADISASGDLIISGKSSFTGNVTASGDISASGHIYVGNTVVLNNNTGGDYIDYQDGGFYYKGNGMFNGHITASNSIKFGDVTMTHDAARRSVTFTDSAGRTVELSLR